MPVYIALLRGVKLPVSVIVGTAAEMFEMAADNAFLKGNQIDTARLAVTFLHGLPTEAALPALGRLQAPSERFHSDGKEIDCRCSGGFANSNPYMPDKALSQRTTARNWDTVKRLRKMARE